MRTKCAIYSLAVACFVLPFQNCSKPFQVQPDAQLSMASTGLSSNQLLLAWDKSPSVEVTGYRVYLGEKSGIYTRTVDVGMTADPKAPSATLSDLQISVPYFVVVKAYDQNGKESPASNEVNFSIK